VPYLDRLFFTTGGNRKLYSITLRTVQKHATEVAELPLPNGIPLHKGLSGFVFHSSENCLFVADFDGKAIWKVSVEGVLSSPPISCPDGPVALAVEPSSGHIFFTTPKSIYKLNPTNNEIVFVAGSPNDALGHRDGPADQSLFNIPQCLAFSPIDNSLIIVESGNNCIRRISLKDRIVTTIAGMPGKDGEGFGDGKALGQAKFNWPFGIAIDSFGRIFVGDTFNHCIRMISMDGVVSTIAGQPKTRGHVDGPASQAKFEFTLGICVDSTSQTLLIADGHGFRVIRAISTIFYSSRNANSHLFSLLFRPSCELFRLGFTDDPLITAGQNPSIND